MANKCIKNVGNSDGYSHFYYYYFHVKIYSSQGFALSVSIFYTTKNKMKRKKLLEDKKKYYSADYSHFDIISMAYNAWKIIFTISKILLHSLGNFHFPIFLMILGMLFNNLGIKYWLVLFCNLLILFGVNSGSLSIILVLYVFNTLNY